MCIRDRPLLMSLHYILRKQETACDILAHLTCHVVTLHAVYSRILVGVFLLYRPWPLAPSMTVVR